ncbi:MAG: peptidoglycan DD-metalloendopeptidase family protein [Roseiarcus sp.]
MSFALRPGRALFAGLERWFMSLGEGCREPGLPTTHYFLSLSRGDAIRTVMLRPAGLWAIAALTALLIVWASAVSAYIAFHDDLLSAVVTRQAAMESAYESRLAEARARLDEVAGQRALDLKSFARKLSELASRQARLEKRGALVAALAAESEGRNPSAREGQPAQASPADALGAIRALGPPLPAEGDAGAARAYAPLPGLSAEPGAMKPHPVDEPGETLSARPAPSLTAAADDLDAAARSAIIDRSLDQMDSGQMKALAAIGRSAERIASRDAAIVARTGLDPAKLTAPHAEGGVGGPFIPAEVDPNAPAFDQALTSAARDVAMAERLKALMPFMPVRMPLFGDASISSPFGYRADPFLGRLALHPGVDLVEAWGADIHATGAGRVTHAGPMGGYGIMVEIDHGNGLITRYAHMSKALVEEGQDVVQGAVLGKMGSSGRSTGPHLHYEVRVDGDPVDPERYLRAGADLTAAE